MSTQRLTLVEAAAIHLEALSRREQMIVRVMGLGLSEETAEDYDRRICEYLSTHAGPNHQLWEQRWEAAIQSLIAGTGLPVLPGEVS